MTVAAWANTVTAMQATLATSKAAAFEAELATVLGSPSAAAELLTRVQAARLTTRRTTLRAAQVKHTVTSLPNNTALMGTILGIQAAINTDDARHQAVARRCAEITDNQEFDPFQFRETLVLGAYNPLLYAGPTPETFENLPWQQIWPITNRVGIYGRDYMRFEDEGTNQVRTFSTPGQVICDTVFYCRVSVSAANVTFINCLFLGPATQGAQCFTATNAGCVGLVLIDCTFVPQNPNRWASGIIIGLNGALFDRCDFYGQSDAITPGNRWDSAVIVRQSAIHDMIAYCPDPGAAGGITDAITHVDQSQMIGGTLIIQGSGYDGFFHPSTRYMQANQPPVGFGGTPVNPTYHMFGNRYWPDLHTTSSVMMSPATYPLIEFEFSNGWIDGAALPINCAAMNSASRFAFDYNVVGNSRRSVGSSIGPFSFKTILARASLQPVITCVGNRRATDGTLLTKAELIQTGA